MTGGSGTHSVGVCPANWRKTFFDWPGLGAIPARADVDGFDDLVTLVLEKLDGPADIVAQSMGGVVALRVALEHPHLVRRLVLVATSGGVDSTRFGPATGGPTTRAIFPSPAPGSSSSVPI